MNKKSIKDIALKGKKVIIRVDFNVPLDEKQGITDDRRIQAAIPTIKYALAQGAKKVILMSHLGRPKGKVVEEMRLFPAAQRLESLLKENVSSLKDCVGEAIKKAIATGSPRIVLLENLRFHKEETDNDPEFAKALASLADIYVNDAFGSAHRAHASTEGITKYLPSVAGFLMEKELNYLGQVVSHPAKPLVVILGGAKVSDKIMLIENLLTKADSILIGGGMAYTFLKAQGISIGQSLLEADKIDFAKSILAKAKAAHVQIVISHDFVIVDDFGKPAHAKISDKIPDGWQGIDIGPKTRQQFKEILSKAKTVVWNGPVGVFEVEAYSKGTQEIAEYLAGLKGVTTIVGGGDSAAAVSKFGVADKMTHISTGGGASLELLEGKQLPGVVALNDKQEKVAVR